jgi:hypothetical protein
VVVGEPPSAFRGLEFDDKRVFNQKINLEGILEGICNFDSALRLGVRLSPVSLNALVL